MVHDRNTETLVLIPAKGSTPQQEKGGVNKGPASLLWPHPFIRAVIRNRCSLGWPGFQVRLSAQGILNCGSYHENAEREHSVLEHITQRKQMKWKAPTLREVHL